MKTTVMTANTARPESSPNVSLEAFLLMTELILDKWKNCSTETKRILIKDLLDNFEKTSINMNFGWQNSVEKSEHELIKNLVRLLKSYRRETFLDYFNYIIDNEAEYKKLREEIKLIKPKTIELKNKLEEYYNTSPEMIFEEAQAAKNEHDRIKNEAINSIKIKMNYINRKPSEQNKSYREYWLEKKLIPNYRKNSNFDSFIKIIFMGFENQEIFNTSRKISNYIKSKNNPVNIHNYPYLFRLIELYLQIAESDNDCKFAAKQHRDFNSNLSILTNRYNAYDIFIQFARDISEAIFYSTFFPDDSVDSPAKRKFLQKVQYAVNPTFGHPSDSRITLRLREIYGDVKPSDDLTNLSIDEKINLLKDIDIVSMSKVLVSCLGKNVTEREIRNLLKGVYNDTEMDQLVLEAKASIGDVESQLEILKSRKFISTGKNIFYMNNDKYRDVASEYYLQSKGNHKIQEKYLDSFIQSEKWPIHLENKELEHLPKKYMKTLFALAVKLRKMEEITILENSFRNDNYDLAEDQEILRAIRNADNEFILHFFERNPTANVNALFIAAKIQKLNKGTNQYLERLENIYSSEPTSDLAEKILSIAENYQQRDDAFLKNACASGSSSICQKAAIEIAFRRFSSGDHETARKYVEKYAQWNLESAHLMYQIEPENIQWLESMSFHFSEHEMQRIKERFKSAGLMPATQLDDPHYHLGLINKKESKLKERVKRNRYSITEDWVCRKKAFAQLQGFQTECAFHFQEPTNSSYKSLTGSENGLESSFSAFNLRQAELFLANSKEELVREPYDWQLAALSSWVEHGRQGIVEAVTGSGKSHVGTLAISEALSDSFAVLVIVPTRALGDQWMTQSLDNFRNRGILNRLGNTTSRDAKAPYSQGARPGYVTVAVISAELENDVKNWVSNMIPGTRIMLVADEVHHLGGGSYQNLLMPIFERRMGLTATLLRDEYEGSRSKNYFSGDPIYRYDFSRAISEKVIVPFTLITLGVKNPNQYNNAYRVVEAKLRRSRESLQHQLQPYSSTRIRVSELEEYAKQIINNPKSQEDEIQIATSFLKAQLEFDDMQEKYGVMNADGAIIVASPLIAKIGRTAIFADFRDTTQNVIAALNTRRIDCEFIQGDTTYSEREDILKRLSEGDLHAVVSPRVLDEGIDIKNLTIGFFAGRIRNRRVLTQRLGRILRTHPEKTMAVAIVMYIVGADDDPTNYGNKRLENSKFDFIGKNAHGEIKNFIVGQDDEAFAKFIDSLELSSPD